MINTILVCIHIYIYMCVCVSMIIVVDAVVMVTYYFHGGISRYMI